MHDPAKGDIGAEWLPLAFFPLALSSPALPTLAPPTRGSLSEEQAIEALYQPAAGRLKVQYCGGGRTGPCHRDFEKKRKGPVL